MKKQIIVLFVIFVSVLSAYFISVFFPNFYLIPYIPAIFLLAYVLIFKRIHEALFIASIICFIFVDYKNFYNLFCDGLIEVMMSRDIVWLLIVCSLMGALMFLVEKSGGSFSFGYFVAKHCHSRKVTLLWTWLLGLSVFIDDYLDSITVGACMKHVTDKYKCSRELLSYVVDSTAAPICVLVPISTWAVFVSRILVSAGACLPGEELSFFIKTIPFNFYAWFALIVVFLVIIGVIPYLGKMKKAEERVLNGGPLAIVNNKFKTENSFHNYIVPENTKIINFVLPMIILISSTLLFDVDMLKGVIFTISFMFLFYIYRGVMAADEFLDYTIEGIKNMISPCLLVILAFLFSTGMDRIGFTQNVINGLVPYMTPELMPFLIFIVLGITEFITGSSWGLYIIALPIIIPLSEQIRGNTLLAISAVLSAGVFGAHVCFYSDATILTSASCGCNNFDHALTQLPYGIICAVLASIAFLVSGFLF